MKQFYNAKDIADLVGVSESKSYSLIRTMNEELGQQGFLTVRGKIPAAYARKRLGIGEVLESVG
ncbi:MAG: hypothetical protein LUD14_06530 [Clostridiales bacterium]|nr:hypothetical protein [Clostridiales bacterium]